MEAVIESAKQKQGVSADGKVDVKAIARLELEAKTVDQVYLALSSFLRNTELDPEWIYPANLLDDPDEARFGAKGDRLWPAADVSERIAVSVFTGRSEGWMVHVDWISRVRGDESTAWGHSIMAMLRAKVPNRDQAWNLARVLAHKLDAA